MSTIMSKTRHLLFILFTLWSLSCQTVQAQDTSSSSETEFQNLVVAVDNLNVLSPFANQEDYAQIQQLVQSLQNKDIAQSDIEQKAVLEKLRVLMNKLYREYSQSFNDIPDEVLARHHRDNILKNCSFDPEAERKLERLIRDIGSTTDSKQREATIRRIQAPSKACQTTLELVAKSLDRDIDNLNNEIALLTDEINEIEKRLEATSDQEEKNKLKQELEAKEKKRQEKKELREKKKKVRGKIDLGLLISGLVNMAVGYALTVFSSGTLATVGGALIKGGLAMVGSSLMPLLKEQEEVTREEVGTGVYERQDTREEHNATDEEWENTNSALKENGYENVSTERDGNFAVFRNEIGDLKIVRIAPREVFATIEHDYPTSAFNDLGVQTMADLSELRVSELSNIKSRIKIVFTAKAPAGQAISGVLLEHARENRFILSVE